MRSEASGVLTLLFAAACVASEPPPVATAQPLATPVAPPAMTPPAAPLPSYAERFASRLRAGVDLTKRIHGPVVVLDIDVQTVTTLCGEAALVEARAWGVDLVDRRVPAATCQPSPDPTELTCIQVKPDVRGLVFDRDGRLVGAYVGTQPLTPFLAELLHARIGTATCPLSP